MAVFPSLFYSLVSPACLFSTLLIHAPLPASFRRAARVCLAPVAVFVDDVCTLTDGASRRNVSQLLGDVETPCQLIIQAG